MNSKQTKTANRSEAELTEVKAIAEELSTLLDGYDTTENHREKTAMQDRIIEFLRANPSAFNHAHEILDAKMEAAIADFVSKTAGFYSDSARQRRAGESTDLFVSLHHERTSLSGESVDSARKIQNLFEGLSAQIDSQQTK